MTGAATFVLAVAGGAAALALWLDVRLGGRAPATLGRRFAAVVAAMVLLQLGAAAFDEVATSGLATVPRALLTLGVLLAPLTFSFLAATWLLRSLAALPGR